MVCGLSGVDLPGGSREHSWNRWVKAGMRHSQSEPPQQWTSHFGRDQTSFVRGPGTPSAVEGVPV